jgi:uncharacterized protein (TIGR03089 family)
MAGTGDTVGALLKNLVGSDPTRPLLTYYDHRTGERTELSGATLDNWVAKTANLVVDGCGLARGDTAAVWLPPHWQTAAILLGCWTAGLSVAFGAADDTGTGVAFAGTEMIEAAPVELAPGAGERYALGLAPLGMPLAVAPAGWTDYIVEVRGHGDRYSGPHPVASAPAWVRPDRKITTQSEFCAAARRRAGELGMPAGGRVLIDGEAHPGPTEWLLAPLAAGASIVLAVGYGEVHNDGMAALATAERADVTLGPIS